MGKRSVEVKRCSRCLTEKPLDEFSLCGRGIHAACKKCSEYSKEYYRRNRAECLAKMRVQYKPLEKEAVAEYWRAIRVAERGDPTKKKCKVCALEKVLAEFPSAGLTCSACRNLASRNRYQANQAHARVIANTHTRERHAKETSEQRLARKARVAAYKLATADRMREYQARNYIENKVVKNEKAKQNYQANKEQYFCRSQKRRAIKKMAVIDLDKFGEKAVIDACDGTCSYCLKKFDKLTLDHVVPLSRGGSHTYDNLVGACLACNLAKGTKGVLSMLNR